MDVKSLLDRLGTDAHVAKLLGFKSPSSVWRLRNGTTLPSHKTTLRLLELQEGALKKRASKR